MSSKERCLELVNKLTDAQANHVIVMLEAMMRALEEAEDNAFCEALCKEYENDPDKDDCMDLNAFAKELGVNLE